MLQQANSIVCIGGANIDRKAYAVEKIQLYSSNPVTMNEFFGGVTRNVAENLSRLSYHAILLTVVGDDREGKSMIENNKNCGIDVSQIWTYTVKSQ